jgi:CBS domain containing-hemolysin-like protein
MLLVALLFVVLNGLFVAAEFSFVKARKTKMEILAEEGARGAKLALFGVKNLDAYLSVCQLGITLSSLGLGWLGEPAVAALLRPLFDLAGLDNPALVSSLSIAVGFALITFLHVVFGELVPKSISIQKAEASVLLLALPMRVFYVVCFPIVSIMNGISNFFLHHAGFSSASEAGQTHSPEELRMLILDSSREGQLAESEGRMLGNIFSFYKKTAKDIMVHRMDVSALDAAEGAEGAKALARASGHTRFPLYEGSRDNIIGFIHAKDLLQLEPGSDLRAVLRQPLYAYETARLDRLLKLMQDKRQQFCMVVDEYGLWQGVISMEDIMEAIVGDIRDEFDNEEPDFTSQADGGFLVNADLSLEELGGYMEIPRHDKEVNPYKILAAHVIDALGSIPAIGDAVTLCGLRVSVAAMEGNRIRKVRVERPYAVDENAGKAGEP